MAENTYQIVVLGDSIAHGGWPDAMELIYNVALNQGRPIKVENLGACGLPAARARTTLDQTLEPHRPDLVIVQFGLNDLRHDGSRGALPLSTPEEFAEHLQAIARACQAKGARVLLLGNHRCRAPLTMPTGMTYDQTRAAYNRVTAEVARLVQADHLDMAEAIEHANLDWEAIVSDDGVHLSAAGNRCYAHLVVSKVMRFVATASSQAH